MSLRPLADIEAEIRDCLEAIDLHTIRFALGIDEARYHFGDTLAWCDWSQATFGFQRRNTFYYGRLGCWLRLLDSGARERVQHRALSVSKLCELSRIPAARVADFLDRHDADALNRDDLRAAVNHYLGRVVSERLLSYRRLPEPTQLLLGLDDPEQILGIDYEREADFVAAHLRRIRVVADRVHPEALDQLAAEFEAAAAEIRARRLQA